MAEFDAKAFMEKQVQKAMLQVNYAIEAHVDGVLRRAYEAGFYDAVDKGCGCTFSPSDAEFRQFVEELLEELRKEAE